MAITNGYATLAEVKDWLSITDDDDNSELEEAVNAASRWIDQHCQRHFWRDGTTVSPRARLFGASDHSDLDLGAFNDLVEVVSVATDDNDNGVFGTTWAASDYELLPRSPSAAPEPRPYRRIRSTGSRFFPYGGRTTRVQVSGVWGWPAVPDAVQHACLIQAARLFKRKHSPEGVTGWQSDFGPIRVSVRSDPDVMQLLEPYRLTPVLVA